MGGDLDGQVRQKSVYELSLRRSFAVIPTQPSFRQPMRFGDEVGIRPEIDAVRVDEYVLSKSNGRWYYVEEGLLELGQKHHVDPRPQIDYRRP